jgi:hypothetical protein
VDVPIKNSMLFVSGALHLKSPIPRCKLIAAAKEVWWLLRFEIWELFVKGIYRGGKAITEYQCAQDTVYE